MLIRKVLFLSSLLSFGFTVTCCAQFSSGLQGIVQDANGTVIPGATITLRDTATGVSQTTTSGAQGDFRFVSLAPGAYEASAMAKGFAPKKIPVVLQTEQTMNLPISLDVAGLAQSVQVIGTAPVLDTADSRTELTLDEKALTSLPLPGHDLLYLVTTAPGVTGLGINGPGGNGQSNDNYAAETQVTASANGRSSVGNMYVVDGLDITSNITPGVLNLVPNPDTVAETTVQVNTYSVEYGRNSSITEVMTTRAGTDQYHGLLSDYFTNQMMTAGTEFIHNYAPFHTNNMSGTVGGPIPHVHQMYFFFGIEPLRGLTSTGNTVYTFEDAAFTQWAQQNFPNTVGTHLLTLYPPSGASDVAVSKTASQVFGASQCGTSATANIPCNLPVFDTGVFNASNYRNAMQYDFRVDRYFSKDRLYGTYYRTGLKTGGPALRTAMGSPSQYMVQSIQVNETHTFSAGLLNEAGFGFLRMEGLIHPIGPFSVPIVSVTGWSANIGVSQAHEDYVQHHIVWKDGMTYIHGTHDIQFGYEGFHGDNLTFFNQWFSQPNFSFTSLLNLVEGNVHSETGVSYLPLTGQQAGALGGSFQLAGNSTGVYGQDIWRVTRRLTLTYGLRFDDFGNPAPENGSIMSNFFLGPGTTKSQQVANGYVEQVSHAFNHALTAWSPRIGFAWDPTGKSEWVLRGGLGLYHDWVTLGNVQDETGNPPTASVPTFLSDGSTPMPIFGLGTSNTYPFGFRYPVLPSSSLNSHGGLTNGVIYNVAGNDPNLKASNTLNYSFNLSRSVGRNFSASIGYSGSYSNDLFTDFAGHTNNAYYGYDINNFPGSLIQNNGVFVRLNTSFGAIRYTLNGPSSRYNAFIAEFKGRLGTRGFLNVAYTRSSSWDDAYTYPTVQFNTGNYSQYWGPSNWDIPNRLSLTVSYDLPGVHRGGLRYAASLLNNWTLSGLTILQSGTPFTVITTAPFAPVYTNGVITGNTGGDYNADGVNYDYPNIPSTGYTMNTSRQSYLSGVFGSNLTSTSILSVFSPPVLGAEGNELPNRLRNPGYAGTDVSLAKNVPIRERLELQLRLDAFNAFNRPNLGGVGNDLAKLSSFGKVTSTYNPRFVQIGVRLEF